TDRGTIRIALDAAHAPRTVENFARLARSGYFDGLAFHRVVPNFVVQDGCPRGDGWGGPGYAIPCEYNALPYDVGTVGMALAGKGKEMVRGGDWLTPHSAGTPRLDNPPLFLWLQSVAFLVLGVNDRAAIFWSALSGALCIPILYRLARLRLGLDPFESWSAATVLLTTQYFLKYARHAMFDVFLTLLFLVAIYAYVRAVQGERRSFLLLGLATGLGILTKSVLGLFPLTVAVVHLLATGRGRTLRDGWLLGGLGVAALVAAPWYVANFLRSGGQLLEEHFRWLLWQRGLGIGGGVRPWWSYLDYLRELGQVYWPWLPLAVAGLVIAIRETAAPAVAATAPASTAAAAPAVAAPWSRRDTALLLLLWLFTVVGIMS